MIFERGNFPIDYSNVGLITNAQHNTNKYKSDENINIRAHIPVLAYPSKIHLCNIYNNFYFTI